MGHKGLIKSRFYKRKHEQMVCSLELNELISGTYWSLTLSGCKYYILVFNHSEVYDVADLLLCLNVESYFDNFLVFTCNHFRYYGCGPVFPTALKGAVVLDLGSGSGQDCYVLSKLVGPEGRVVGIDMTDEQVCVYHCSTMTYDWIYLTLQLLF